MSKKFPLNWALPQLAALLSQSWSLVIWKAYQRKHKHQTSLPIFSSIFSASKQRNSTMRTRQRGTNLSVLSLSLLKNFSLSSSATLRTLSIKCFLSWVPRFVTSTSSCTILPSFVNCFIIPFFILSNVGSRSIAAHFKAFSSSSGCCSEKHLLDSTSHSLSL